MLDDLKERNRKKFKANLERELEEGQEEVPLEEPRRKVGENGRRESANLGVIECDDDGDDCPSLFPPPQPTIDLTDDSPAKSNKSKDHFVSTSIHKKNSNRTPSFVRSRETLKYHESSTLGVVEKIRALNTEFKRQLTNCSTSAANICAKAIQFDKEKHLRELNKMEITLDEHLAHVTNMKKKITQQKRLIGKTPASTNGGGKKYMTGAAWLDKYDATEDRAAAKQQTMLQAWNLGDTKQRKKSESSCDPQTANPSITTTGITLPNSSIPNFLVPASPPISRPLHLDCTAPHMIFALGKVAAGNITESFGVKGSREYLTQTWTAELGAEIESKNGGKSLDILASPEEALKTRGAALLLEIV
ncbi:hypothetical protein TrRE_jg4809 [Triparma retinervis]|uniref:Uncharacterized protein n=1 Tax=Triparma retinervis TaxID=2557542 RepID=A0A9W7F8W9_9STRA|nr:hypothetical protein TrRE_jg4809 [Triparma retinervis]